MIPDDVDLGFILEEEYGDEYAHRPGGSSGITLGPGLDLRYIEEDLAVRALEPHLTAGELETVVEALRMRVGGNAAQELFDSDMDLIRRLKEIRITYEQAQQILAVTAGPYWEAIAVRYVTLNNDDTPSGVKTAMLSLAYNYGAGSHRLSALAPAIERHDWPALATAIEKLEANPARRLREAKIVRDELYARFLAHLRGLRWFKSGEILRAVGGKVPPRPWDGALPALRLLDRVRSAIDLPIRLTSLSPGSWAATFDCPIPARASFILGKWHGRKWAGDLEDARAGLIRVMVRRTDFEV